MQTQHYPATDNFLEALLKSQYTKLGPILADPEKYRLQIIYTRIDRDTDQFPHFTDYHYGVSPDTYFYPASTVKLPAAALALEKINDLRTPLHRDLPFFTAPLQGVNTSAYRDPTAPEGLPSIANYIKKIFLISDNDAYNRLYEWLGQQSFNLRLWEMGYKNIQIRHRVGLPLHEEANRWTNPVSFRQDGNILYRQDAQYSRLSFQKREDLIGHAHYNHLDKLEMSPMDFSSRNRLPLTDLHHLLRSIIFPKAVTIPQRFRLTDADYRFLYSCMSAYPTKEYPGYDPALHCQAYTKFLLFGGQKASRIPKAIRIFNKPGWAYGFLTDTAYIVNLAEKTEFLLSASLFVNTSGILGDDYQAFEELGKPFLKALGEVIYKMESERNRDVKPDLSGFDLPFNY